MECAKTKELLSEYIDGVLDPRRKALVEEHLLTCEGCKEEVASLKALVDELGALESVEAPKDFLERLHERMESRFTFGKLVRMLFVPVRIKIPLEFATAAAVAILIFAVLGIQQREKQVVEAPQESTQVRIAKKITADRVEPKLEKEAYKPKPASEEAAVQQPERERETVELALLLKTEVSKIAYAPRAAMEAAPAPEERAGGVEEEKAYISPPRRKRVIRRVAPTAKIKTDEHEKENRARGGEEERTYKTSPPRTGPVGLAAPKAEIETDERGEEKRLMGSLMEERLPSKDEPGLSASHLDETLSKVKNLVRLVEGRVTSIEYEKETKRPQSIRAEIPAKHYHSFCEQLKRLAVLQAPPPPISEKPQEVIQIRISFISSD